MFKYNAQKLLRLNNVLSLACRCKHNDEHWVSNITYILFFFRGNSPIYLTTKCV